MDRAKYFQERLQQGRRVAFISANNLIDSKFSVLFCVNNGETAVCTKSYKSLKGARKAAQKFFDQA